TLGPLLEGVVHYFALTMTETNGSTSTQSPEVSAIPTSPVVVNTNQPPTLNAIGNVSVNENAGLQTVNLSGITAGAGNGTQTLTVSAVSSNPGLIPNPVV